MPNSTAWRTQRIVSSRFHGHRAQVGTSNPVHLVNLVNPVFFHCAHVRGRDRPACFTIERLHSGL
jgi:hypothetical protein